MYEILFVAHWQTYVPCAARQIDINEHVRYALLTLIVYGLEKINCLILLLASLLYKAAS